MAVEQFSPAIKQILWFDNVNHITYVELPFTILRPNISNYFGVDTGLDAVSFRSDSWRLA